MPIYEYKCLECGKIEEFLIFDEKDVPVRCTSCGSQNLQRIMSTASFINGSTSFEKGHTCCGREEPCSTPPCATGGECRKNM